MSLALCAGFGVAGPTSFVGPSGRTVVLAGPTGGYIMGFLPATLLMGPLIETCVRSRSFFTMLGLWLFASFGLIRLPESLQLHFWLSSVKGQVLGSAQLLTMGSTPYVVGDITEAIIAAAVARLITPRQAYDGEVDAGKWTSWRVS